MFRIILLGPQGSGKGTQAELLSKKFHIPNLSMGQLLREEVAEKTVLGEQIEEILCKGDLVPETVTTQVLKKRLSQPDTQDGWIIDGFPRMMAQYETFTFGHPTHVIVLDIPRKETIQRLYGRLTCDRCGMIGNVYQGTIVGDTCPKCGGVFTKRDDDKPEAIDRRLEVYTTQTKPVIEAYRSEGIVIEINGTGSIEEVFERILDTLSL